MDDAGNRRLAEKLDHFDQWFSGDPTYTESVDVEEGLPSMLAWALRHPRRFGQRFWADAQPDESLRCFSECGDVFDGFIDDFRSYSLEANPTVEFDSSAHCRTNRRCPWPTLSSARTLRQWRSKRARFIRKPSWRRPMTA